MQTLDDFLAGLSNGDATRNAAAEAVRALAKGAIGLRDVIAGGENAGALARASGATGGGGDQQHGLDIIADQLMLEAISRSPVAVYASEELEHPVVLDRTAPLALALDPLDGSSNIETNVSIGTIFSLQPVAGDLDSEAVASFMQPGRNQVAAGFFVYGPQLSLVLSFGSGTHIFVHSPRAAAFVHVHRDLKIPAATHEYAINGSNYRHWDDAVRHYIDDCLLGAEGPHGRDFNMRWLASVVAEAYRILIRGGVFLYPGDSRKGYSKGRLRLVYEANPLAMVIEQAGGLATNGREPILDLTAATLHERTPLVFGSRNEVERVTNYHADPEPMGVRSPLFGRRGLFRS